MAVRSPLGARAWGLALLAVLGPVGLAPAAAATTDLELVEQHIAYFSVVRQSPLVVGPGAALVLPPVGAVGSSWADEPRAVLEGETQEWSVPVGADAGSGRGVVDLDGVPAGDYTLYVDTYAGSGGVSWMTPVRVRDDGPDLVAVPFDDTDSTRLQGFAQAADARLVPGDAVRIVGVPGRDLSGALVLLVVVEDEDFAFYPQDELHVRASRDGVSFTVPATFPATDGLADLTALGLADVGAQLSLPGPTPLGLGQPDQPPPPPPVADSGEVGDLDGSPAEGVTATRAGEPLAGAHAVYLSVLVADSDGAFGPTTVDHALDGVVIDAHGRPAPRTPGPEPTGAPTEAPAPVGSVTRPTAASGATPSATLNPGLAVDTGWDAGPDPGAAPGPRASLLLAGAAALAAAVAATGRRRRTPRRVS